MVLAAVLDWFRGRRTAQWELVSVHGSAPQARSMYGAAVLDGKMYIVGGCCNDCYLSDAQVLDLGDLHWSELQPCPISCAGHTLIAREEDKTIIALVGIPSDKKLRVYKFDASSTSWTLVATKGDTPLATRGHSATLVESKIWLFGGEDFSGQQANHLHILDLESNTWERVNASELIPPPLSFHGASKSSGGDFLYIFGGRTVSGLSSDMYVLDLKSKAWSTSPGMDTPGAYFGVATVGDDCYLVAAGKTLLLNMSSRSWTVVAADTRLACEGVSLVHAQINNQGTLIAFGGQSVKESGVLMLKTMEGYRPRNVISPGFCVVRDPHGAFLARFLTPEAGKHAWEVIEALTDITGQAGRLWRADFVITSNDLVYPGEELVFRSSVGSGYRLELTLSTMDVMSCKNFLQRMKIKVTSGGGWLKSETKLRVEPFDWKSAWSDLQAQALSDDRVGIADYLVGYLEDAGLKAICTMLFLLFGEVEEISGSAPFSYELKFTVPVVLKYMDLDNTCIGLWIEENVSEQSIWRALVALLALNIKNHHLKPWMVITDCRGVWHFAWMDGSNMFLCNNVPEGLSVLHDLTLDYEKTTSNATPGLLSSLPSVFNRISVPWSCDHEEVITRLFPRVTGYEYEPDGPGASQAFLLQ